MIPNTTQTPNCIFDYWMSRLKGGELKVLLAVVRHTIGWLEDPETGRRREKDHISHARLVEMTGTSGDTVTRALAKLIDELGIVEALDEEENLLDNPESRRKVGQSQKPIYYRIPLEKLHLETYPQNQDSSKETYPQNQDSHLSAKSGTESKERSTKKKQTSAVRFPNDWYKQNVADYQEIKGVPLNGPEFGEIQRTLKTIYKASHTPEDIRALMETFEASKEEWTDNWTIHTVARKLPEFLAGKLFGNNRELPPDPKTTALEEDIYQVDRVIIAIRRKLDAYALIEDGTRRYKPRELTIDEEEKRAQLRNTLTEKEEERARLVSELKKQEVSGEGAV